MGFWIQLGVSGFRMDAVPFVIATKGAAELDGTHDPHAERSVGNRMGEIYRSADANA
jgi:glycosidase